MIASLADLKTSLDKLIEHNWENELADYRDNCSTFPGDCNQRSGHIFETMVLLDNFIHESERTPEEWIKE